MSIPEEVIEKIEEEIEKEIDSIKGISDGPPMNLFDLEKKVVEIRNNFGKRLMEAAVKYQGEGEIIKKNARNALKEL